MKLGRVGGSPDVSRLVRRYGLGLMLAALVFVFWLLNPNFVGIATLDNVITQNSAIAILAIGMTFVIISGNIDVSVGAAMGFLAMVLGVVYRNTGSLPLAVTVSALAALAVGLFQGGLVGWLRISSVIVTLAGFIWLRGVAFGLTSASSVPIEGFLVDIMLAEVPPGIPLLLILVAAVFAVAWLLLNRTRFGRYLHAVGGDEGGAAQAALPVAALKTSAMVLAMFAAFGAAMVETGRLAVAQPNAGIGFELDAIVAVVIGGAVLTGGSGSLSRTLLGVAFIAVLNVGLNSLGLRDAHFLVAKGLVILSVLAIEVSNRSRESAPSRATANDRQQETV